MNTEEASKFIDKKWSGGDHTVCAYPHALVFHNGRRHLTWCWRDTPGTKYVNGGSMTVDQTGRVHVLVRGEEGLPVYFHRGSSAI